MHVCYWVKRATRKQNDFIFYRSHFSQSQRQVWWKLQQSKLWFGRLQLPKLIPDKNWNQFLEFVLHICCTGSWDIRMTKMPEHWPNSEIKFTYPNSNVYYSFWFVCFYYWTTFVLEFNNRPYWKMAVDLIFFYMHINWPPYDLVIVQEIQKNFYSKTRS